MVIASIRHDRTSNQPGSATRRLTRFPPRDEDIGPQTHAGSTSGSLMYGLVRLSTLIRSQWRSRRDLQHHQLVQLRRLVRHASRHVPFYRRLYESAGVSADDLTSLEQLNRFPIVRRQDLQECPKRDLVASDVNPDHCNSTRTSGSTGVPQEILSMRRDRASFNPSFFRVYHAWGLRPWHRLTFFQARPEALGIRSWYESFGLARRQMLSSNDDPRNWIARLRQWRPHLVHGYSLTLKLLAEAILEDPSENLRIPLVVSTSGVLDAAGREMLTAALGGSVVDIYASEEAGAVIAWQCPECSGYHVDIDTGVTEIVTHGAPVEPGDDGDVLITNLSNFTMPFIRYDLGDTARMSVAHPTCGRGLPLLDSITGRQGDFVVLRSGRRLSPHAFFLVLDHALGVGRWQVFQPDLDHLEVRITQSGRDAPSLVTSDIRESLCKLVGPEVDIMVEKVETIDRGGSFKLRSVVSRL